MGKRIIVLLCLAFGLVTVATWLWQLCAPVTITITQPQRPLSQSPSPVNEKAVEAAEAPTPPVSAAQTSFAEAEIAAVRGMAPTQTVAATQFGVGRGFYETDLAVELLCATPNAVIHYTTDGSDPKVNSGAVYSTPIHIPRTTVLRAAAFKPGWAPSSINTHTYVFPNDVMASRSLKTSIAKHPAYRSQMRDALLGVPSLSLVTSAAIQEEVPTYGRGPVRKNKPVKASLEWLAAGGGPGFQEDCGVEYYGGGWTPFAKKNFRLHFRREFGALKLKFPVFAGHEHGLAAVAEFDQLELRSGSHDMVERGFYLSNIFADDSMLEMGHLSPHGRFVHLYLNGAYWGVFHLRERWGAGMHRRYLGGTSSDYESINGNLNVGGWAEPGVPYDGNGRTWARVHSLRGNYKAVKQWVDVPDYIDYMILFIFGRCEDEYRCVGPTVPGSGFKFYLNDADGFFQSPAHPWYGEPSDRTARGAPGRQAGDGPASIFSTLLAEGNPDYRTLLADRIYKAYFNGGALTFNSVSNRLKIRCDELEKVFVAEAARWAYRTPDDWRSVRDDVFTHWLPTRSGNVLGELRAAGLYPSLDAPKLNQQGGKVTNGFQVLFRGPRKGDIFFTLDGSDPRLPGGGVAPSAQRYIPGQKPSTATGSSLSSTSPRIDRNTAVKSRVRDGKEWSALNEAFFQIGPAALEAGEVGITELSFDRTANGGAEFVEVGNISSRAVNLRGARFTDGIDYAFADNRDTILAPGQKLVLVKDLFRFRQQRGLETAVEGIYARKNKKGEGRVTLSLESGQVVTSRLIAGAEPSQNP